MDTDRTLPSNRLIFEVRRDAAKRERFRSDPEGLMRDYGLSDAEQRAFREIDIKRLGELGDEQEALLAGYARMAEGLRAARPDVIVGIANDHLLNFSMLSIPDWCVGTAERWRGPAEWFRDWINVPDYEVSIEKMITAGDGGTIELRAWLVAMGAAGKRAAQTVFYVPSVALCCGMGGVTWNIAA